MAGWVLYAAAAFLDVLLVACTGFFMILFADLEADYTNPYDFCTRINSWVLPECGAHVFLTGLFLLSGEWWMVLLNVPLLGYHVYRYYTKTHLYYASDAIKALDSRRQESNLRFGFYLMCFFYYVYSMVIELRDRV